jgi:hypothetical protein
VKKTIGARIFDITCAKNAQFTEKDVAHCHMAQLLVDFYNQLGSYY